MVKPTGYVHKIDGNDMSVGGTKMSNEEAGCLTFLSIVTMLLVAIASMCTIVHSISGVKNEKTVVQTTEVVVPIKAESKQEMVRFYMHDVNSYSAYKMIGNKLEHHYFNLRSYLEFEIFCDVAIDEPMWFIETETKKKSWWKRVEFHIHAPNDINAGGWDHGKYGHGKTNVIE